MVEGMKLEMRVPGEPAPQGSKGINTRTGRMYEMSSAKLRAWRKAVADVAVAGLRGHLFTGPVRVEATCYLTRPRQTKLRHPRTDVDKLARAILDALTGSAFEDDSQVVYLRVRKEWCPLGQESGAQIIVEDA